MALSAQSSCPPKIRASSILLQTPTPRTASCRRSLPLVCRRSCLLHLTATMTPVVRPTTATVGKARAPEGVLSSSVVAVKATPTTATMATPAAPPSAVALATEAVAAPLASAQAPAMALLPDPTPQIRPRGVRIATDSRRNGSSKSARRSLQWVRPPGTALCAPPDVFVLRHRLASRLMWWKDAGACRQILRTLKHGVHLEFARNPRPFQSRPIPDPERWRPWLHQELDRAIAAGAYEAATCSDFVAPAFIIKQHNKFCLVINFGKSTNCASTCPVATKDSRTSGICFSATIGCCRWICRTRTGTFLLRRTIANI